MIPIRAKPCKGSSLNWKTDDAAMPALESLLVIEEAEPQSAAMNMALDEALLEQAKVPTLRCYQWRKLSLSFGYFGRFAEVANEEGKREIVRRWTGGGIVLHGADFTYSVIIPAHRPGPIAGARVIYEQIHDAIRRALSSHIAVVLAAEDAPKVSEACFANPVTADVLANGRKIAGAAQRRTRAGLLHQGSIQCEALPVTFPAAFASALCPQWRPTTFEPELIERARTLAEEKYATAAWLRQR